MLDKKAVKLDNITELSFDNFENFHEACTLAIEKACTQDEGQEIYFKFNSSVLILDKNSTKNGCHFLFDMKREAWNQDDETTKRESYQETRLAFSEMPKRKAHLRKLGSAMHTWNFLDTSEVFNRVHDFAQCLNGCYGQAPEKIRRDFIKGLQAKGYSAEWYKNQCHVSTTNCQKLLLLISFMMKRIINDEYVDIHFIEHDTIVSN